MWAGTPDRADRDRSGYRVGRGRAGTSGVLPAGLVSRTAEPEQVAGLGVEPTARADSGSSGPARAVQASRPRARTRTSNSLGPWRRTKHASSPGPDPNLVWSGRPLAAQPADEGVGQQHRGGDLIGDTARNRPCPFGHLAGGGGPGVGISDCIVGTVARIRHFQRRRVGSKAPPDLGVAVRSVNGLPSTTHNSIPRAGLLSEEAMRLGRLLVGRGPGIAEETCGTDSNGPPRRGSRTVRKLVRVSTDATAWPVRGGPANPFCRSGPPGVFIAPAASRGRPRTRPGAGHPATG